MKRTLYNAETNEPYKDYSDIEVDSCLDISKHTVLENIKDGTEDCKTIYDLKSFIVHFGEYKTPTGKVVTYVP